jgi:hypothetical protein
VGAQGSKPNGIWYYGLYRKKATVINYSTIQLFNGIHIFSHQLSIFNLWMQEQQEQRELSTRLPQRQLQQQRRQSSRH